QIGVCGRHFLERIAFVFSLAANFHIRLVFQQLSKTVSKQLVIINKKRAPHFPASVNSRTASFRLLRIHVCSFHVCAKRGKVLVWRSVRSYRSKVHLTMVPSESWALIVKSAPIKAARCRMIGSPSPSLTFVRSIPTPLSRTTSVAFLPSMS